MSRSSPPVEPDDLIAVGVIRKSHGVRGEMSVEPLTETPERFRDLGDVWLVSPDRSEMRPGRLTSARTHKDRALVGLEGITDPESVAPFRNWTIEIHSRDAKALEENEFFIHDLIGLRMIAPDDRFLGTITDVVEGGGGLLLVVEPPDRPPFEVPFAQSICTRIDPAAGTVVADLPEGLEDLSRAEEVAQPPAGEEYPAASVRLRMDFVTIFPSMFDAILREGVVAQAIKGGILAVRVWDLRDFTSDKHRSTDDIAYGGGAGMVMLAEPVFKCMEAIRASDPDSSPLVILTSPQGEPFEHETARDLAAGQWLVFLCGRYEGFDERVREALVDRELSIGDFVVSGGELPAMLVADAVARLVEGVVGDWNSVEGDSFYSGLLDHPHYTRPAELRGMKVPEVLLSGHAERIRKWRKEQALRATALKRPDLLERAKLNAEETKIAEQLLWSSPGEDQSRKKP